MARKSSAIHLRRQLSDFKRVADSTARTEPPRRVINRVIEALEEFTHKLPQRPEGLSEAQYKYHRESIQAELDFIANKLRQAR